MRYFRIPMGQQLSIIPQLSVITDEISQDFDHALDIAQKYGIETVEVRNLWDTNIALLSDDELNQMQMALEKRKMRLSVVCSPFMKCFLPDSWLANTNAKNLTRNPDYNLSLFDRLIYMADFFHTPFIRIFNFLKNGLKVRDNEWSSMINILRPYVEKAEKAHKVLLLENETNTYADTIAHTLKLFEEIQSPAFKLNLDPGNFYSIREETTPEAYEIFYQKGLVAHMHVKDPRFHLPFIGSYFNVVGTGKIDYISLFKQAKEHGYSGLFSLETHCPSNREKVSIESLEYLQKTLPKIK